MTILGLVAACIGYSIVPDTSVHSHPSATWLVSHPELTLKYPVKFVWKHDDEFNGPLARFIREVKAHVLGEAVSAGFEARLQTSVRSG